MTNPLPVVFTAAWKDDVTLPESSRRESGQWLAYVGERVWCAGRAWTIAAITYDPSVNASVPQLDLVWRDSRTESDEKRTVAVQIGEAEVCHYIRESLTWQAEGRMTVTADQCMIFIQHL